jgi:hypothetical protein
MASPPNRGLFQLQRAKDFEIDCIVEIVAVVGNLIRQVRDLRLERWALVFVLSWDRRIVKRLVLLQSLPDLECQIQAGKGGIRRLEQFDDALALPVVVEAAVPAHAFGEHLFARMSKRRMSQIVRQRDRLSQVLI